MPVATTLPEPLIVDHQTPPPGYWEREPSHFPLPITPFTKVLMQQEFWGRQICSDIGSLIETIRFVEIGGWVYSRVVPVGDRPGQAPPAWLMPVLLRTVPAVRRRTAAARDALREDVPGKQIDRWYEEWEPALAARLAEARSVDLTTLSDAELDDHLVAAIELALDSFFVHFRLHFAIGFVLGTFATTCHELLGWTDEQSVQMLTGSSTRSTAPAHALADLAGMAAGSPKVCALLSSASVDEVLAADPAFATAFTRFVDNYCYRALTYDLSDPVLAERQELVLSLISDQLALRKRADEGLGDGADTVAAAREQLAGAPAADRGRFERDLARALKAYPVREDNVYPTVSAPMALVRFAALELGRRLTARGDLDDAADIFLLYVDEARSALQDHQDSTTLVDRRKAERGQTMSTPGPASYGPPPGPPPSLRGLPPAAREFTRYALWLLEQLMPPPVAQPTPTQDLVGIAAARGTATGRVRVIMDESEFDKLAAGDVLVCPCTSPAWSILFPSIAAVVTDSGGILSHPAIVAREYGIPAVVATGDATSRLRDGQRVVVDGTAGTVRIEQ